MLLYALGLDSPTYPLPVESYAAWTPSYKWKDIYGYELLYGGSLFIHQYSHVWVDFRGIQDAFARDKGIEYCEEGTAWAKVLGPESAFLEVNRLTHARAA